MMNNKLMIQREMNPAVWQLITGIAETTAVAQSQKAEIAKKLLFCYENELPLSLAVNGGLYVVNGRLAVEGTTIRAQIRKHADYDYAINRLDDTGCEIAIMFRGEPLGTAEFTQDDAKLAGLLKGDNYQKYPTDMYLNRATSRAYKRFCPDLFMQSVYVRGELEEPTPDPIPQDTIQSLIDEFGSEAVLDAMTHAGGSIDEIRTYLNEVE